MASRIIVTQIGARHRYLIPYILEKNQMLYRLYTDSTKYSTLGQITQVCERVGIKTDKMRRLIDRNPAVARNKVFSSDRLFYKELWHSLFSKDEYYRYELQFTGMGSKFEKWGVGEADCVYGMYFENIDFLRFAKSKGLKVVVDIYEQPTTYIEAAHEIEDTPELQVFQSVIPMLEAKHTIRMRYINELLELADYYTIPSQCVCQSLLNYKSFDENKVVILPYGSSITQTNNNWKPVKHRLLFVGGDAVNKGLLYCAKAAYKLKKIYPDLDFRVAGIASGLLDDILPFSSLHFLGFLDKESLIQEYCSAEAMVFPTLHEGFAGSIIEAASCGCPVITTENSGADKDTFPAVFIQEKCTDAIVEEVSRLFEEKEKKESLSKRLFDYASSFDPDAYEKRLVMEMRRI